MVVSLFQINDTLCKNIQEYFKCEWDIESLDSCYSHSDLIDFELKTDFYIYLTRISGSIEKNKITLNENPIIKITETEYYNYKTGVVMNENNILYQTFDDWFKAQIPYEAIVIPEILSMFERMDPRNIPMWSESIVEVFGKPVFYSCEVTDTAHNGDMMFGIRNMSDSVAKVAIQRTYGFQLDPGQFEFLPLFLSNDPRSHYFLECESNDCITYHVLFGGMPKNSKKCSNFNFLKKMLS